MTTQTGQYRIDDVVFIQAPTASWENQLIRDGLNGLPINSSYQMHRWTFAELDTDSMESLLDKFYEQQTGSAQLSQLETDPYNASSSSDDFHTSVYTDFVIKSVDPRQRGLPRYENVSVAFEVYIG